MQAEALRVELRPGDAFDPNPGGNPTERVELQARHELVKFDRPVWYAFRFRLLEPWLPAGAPLENRTVIHQVKQNIVPEKEIQHGGICPSANPFFKIEAGYRAATKGPGFIVKTRGTDNCLDGKSGETVCGPWTLDVGKWHVVHIAMKATQQDGKSDLRVWLDGRPCVTFTGKLGYSDHGKRTTDGRPYVDAQPRFGIYRDVLPEKLRPESIQSIEFAEIAFWNRNPADHPAWKSIDLATSP